MIDWQDSSERAAWDAEQERAKARDLVGRMAHAWTESLNDDSMLLREMGLFIRGGMAEEPADTFGFAVYDRQEIYRYSLARVWSSGGVVNFIMLNPSTATEQRLDPTLRRCYGYAKAWGYGGFVVTNLFAYRATNPSDMKRALAPIGEYNDFWIARSASQSALAVAGWGAHGFHARRGKIVERKLRELMPQKLHILRLTSWGYPSHPLYLPGDLKPVLWREGMTNGGSEESSGEVERATAHDSGTDRSAEWANPRAVDSA